MKNNWMVFQDYLINLNNVETIWCRGDKIRITFVGGDEDYRDFIFENKDEATRKFTAILEAFSHEYGLTIIK